MAYTPPTYNAVDFGLTTGYAAPAYNAVDFELSASPMAAAPAAVATLTASLTTGRIFASVAAVATVAATLRVPAGLAASPAALATAAAQLTTTTRIEASLGAAAALTASLRTPARFRAAPAADAEVSPGLRTPARLGAGLAADAEDAVTLRVGVRLAAAPAASAALTANLRTAAMFQAAPAAQATVDAFVHATGHMVARPAAVATVTASLVAAAHLRAELAALAALLPATTFRATGHLEAAASASARVFAALTEGYWSVYAVGPVTETDRAGEPTVPFHAVVLASNTGVPGVGVPVALTADNGHVGFPSPIVVSGAGGAVEIPFDANEPSSGTTITATATPAGRTVITSGIPRRISAFDPEPDNTAFGYLTGVSWDPGTGLVTVGEAIPHFATPSSWKENVYDVNGILVSSTVPFDMAPIIGQSEGPAVNSYVINSLVVFGYTPHTSLSSSFYYRGVQYGPNVENPLPGGFAAQSVFGIPIIKNGVMYATIWNTSRSNNLDPTNPAVALGSMPAPGGLPDGYYSNFVALPQLSPTDFSISNYEFVQSDDAYIYVSLAGGGVGSVLFQYDVGLNLIHTWGPGEMPAGFQGGFTSFVVTDLSPAQEMLLASVAPGATGLFVCGTYGNGVESLGFGNLIEVYAMYPDHTWSLVGNKYSAFGSFLYLGDQLALARDGVFSLEPTSTGVDVVNATFRVTIVVAPLDAVCPEGKADFCPVGDSNLYDDYPLSEGWRYGYADGGETKRVLNKARRTSLVVHGAARAGSDRDGNLLACVSDAKLGSKRRSVTLMALGDVTVQSGRDLYVRAAGGVSACADGGRLTAKASGDVDLEAAAWRVGCAGLAVVGSDTADVVLDAAAVIEPDE